MWIPSWRAAARRTHLAAASASSVSSNGVSLDCAYSSSEPSSSLTEPPSASGLWTSSNHLDAPSERYDATPPRPPDPRRRGRHPRRLVWLERSSEHLLDQVSAQPALDLGRGAVL